MRGEYRRIGAPGISCRGSAPHMRGIPAECGDCEGHGGISPACAGNTPGAWPSTRPNAGQPRTCGEYVDADTDQHRRTGSAPLARGIPTHASGPGVSRRVSPACAGNTGERRTVGVSPACAGNTSSTPRRGGMHTGGSAPLARGIRVLGLGSVPWPGVSPACAGNTGEMRTVYQARGVSPACAGNTTASCPHMHGSRVSPACAGNTLSQTA